MEKLWRHSLQRMVDWIEENIEEKPGLMEMSESIGYSPYYCSRLFHQITGTTLKKYIANRKIAHIAKALRDTDEAIIDIADTYGYTSQSALTRAFVQRFHITPSKYRNNPVPIKLPIKYQITYPEHAMGNQSFETHEFQSQESDNQDVNYDYHGIDKTNQMHNNGGHCMSNLKEAKVRVEYLPKHKFIGIFEPKAKDYMSMWQYHDCEEITGVVESMRHVAIDVVGCHMAGWFEHELGKGYFYGFGVPNDYSGDIPEGFEVREVPESEYLVAYHPAFDFVEENNEVMKRVEELALNYSFDSKEFWWISKGYQWNKEINMTYQRYFPEVFGYEILQPIKK